MVTTKPITTSDSQFTMGHNRSLESSMNRKKRNRKLRKSTYLKIFSSNTFPYSENTSMMSSLLMLSLKIKFTHEEKEPCWIAYTLLICMYMYCTLIWKIHANKFCNIHVFVVHQGLGVIQKSFEPSFLKLNF